MMDILPGLRCLHQTRGDSQVSADKAPLPEVEEIRRRFRSGQSLSLKLTVGEWLDEWLSTLRLRPSAITRYECDVRVHLRPRIGQIKLDRLRVSHLTEMFAAIDETNLEIEDTNEQRRSAKNDLKAIKGRTQRRLAREAIDRMPAFRRTTNAATQQHIRATLRAALNAAIAQQLLTFNPAEHVNLESGKRPKALVWTADRVEQWQQTGERPSPVMVWTPEQIGQFLDHIAEDRLYGLWHVIVHRGLRRGEGCGSRWTDVDLSAGLLTVAKQLTQDHGKVIEAAPKTDSGARTVALDSETLSALKQHRRQQATERLAWGEGWIDTGRVFTRENGEWLSPGWLTDEFGRLVRDAGLPPIRLHDLRHCAATLMLAAGVDMKTIQETLGHSSITITADTYASVLPEVSRAAAEAAAQLVPRMRSHTGAHASLTHAVRRIEKLEVV